MVLIVNSHLQGALITGETYDVKSLLQGYGGRWLSDVKGWFFEREAEVLEALVQNQCIIQDQRPHLCRTRLVSQPTRTRDSSVIVLSKQVAARTRARSRTPPVAPKPARSSESQLPQVNLNTRTVRERTAALLEAAGAANPVSAASQDDFAKNLARKLSEVADEGGRTSYDSVFSRVEEMLKSADTLDGPLLESSGLVRVATRIALLRSSGAASLRCLAKEYWRRWAARRT